MSTIINIILFIIILGVLVFVHEFGHFITAKKNGVFIHEFSIGMGPSIKTIKGKDGINYSIRALPIGGYVQMAGEIYEDDDTKTVPKDEFMCNKKWWQRLMILCAGVFNNFLLALFLLFVIALIWGAQSLTPTITHVVEDSAIAKTQIKETVFDEAEGKEVEIITDGIVDGDIIVAINGHKTKTWDKAQLLLLLKDKDGTYDITVKHVDGKKATYAVKPDIEKDEKGNERAVFGIQMQTKITKGFIPAVKFAFQKFASISEQMWLTLANLFTGKLSINNLSGPVGIYTVVGETRKAGIASILYLTAYLSLNLGIMNILPIPALDGGHVLFLLIEMITKKKVNAKIEAITTTIFFFLLIALMIYITIHDIFTLIL